MAYNQNKLSKIYILKDIDWTMVPNCVLNDLITLCDDCVKNYKFSLPTKESLRYAANLIKKIGSSKLKAHEKEALHKRTNVQKFEILKMHQHFNLVDFEKWEICIGR